MDIEQLLISYGYPILLIGAFIEGEVFLMVAGYVASRGLFPLPVVFAIGTAGSLLGDLGLFAIGRIAGHRLIARFPRLAEKLATMHTHIHARETMFILSARLFYGLRLFTALLLGTTHIKGKKYAILTTLSTLIWAGLFTGAGYLLGYALIPFVARFRQVASEVVIMAISIIVIVGIIRHVVKRKIET